jgi:hypothetical protein
MKRKNRSCIGAGWLCVSLLFAGAASARQKPNDLKSGYDAGREVNLVGTVTSFVADSPTGPLGAHVMVQTAAGPVDVHVGSAKFLQLNNLTLTSGDSVRIIGESFTNGSNTVFLARIIQKGIQAVAVRSPRGMPLWSAGSRVLNATGQKSQGGVQ